MAFSSVVNSEIQFEEILTPSSDNLLVTVEQRPIERSFKEKPLSKKDVTPVCQKLSLDETIDFFNRVLKIPKSVLVKDSHIQFEKLSPSREHQFQVAASYVKDALSGRNIYHRVDKISLLLYKAVKNWIFRILYACCTGILFLLYLFEYPAVVDDFPFGITQSIEIILMIFFIAQAMVKLFIYSPRLLVSRNIVPFLTIVLSLLTLCDIAIYIGIRYVRFTRCLRGFFLLSLTKSIQTHFFYLLYVSSKMVVAVVAILAIITFYAGMGRVIFVDTDEDKYFATFQQAFMSMMTLLTTSNFPDILILSWRNSPITSFFFVSFLFISTYMLLNAVLALVYHSFKTAATKESEENWKMRRRGLVGAFAYIDVENRGYITFAEFSYLLKKISKTFFAKSRPIFHFCGGGTKDDDTISLNNFLQLVDVLHYQVQELKFEQKTKYTLYWFPILPKLKIIVESTIFKIVSQIMVYLSVILTIFLVVFDVDYITLIQTFPEQVLPLYISFHILDSVFLLYFIVEIVVKLLAHGVHRFRKSIWNLVDVLIVLFQLLIKVVAEIILPLCLPEAVIISPIFDRWLELLRLVRLFRVFTISETMRKLVSAYFQIVVLGLFFVCVLTIHFSFFGSIGMELFAFKLTRSDSRMEKTDYHQFDYYGVINFDNAANTWITLLYLMAVNNWHVTMEAIYAVTESTWSILYFVLFYFSTVTFVLNLLIAVIIEAFMSRWTALQEQKMATKLLKQNLDIILEERRVAAELGITLWKLQPKSKYFNTTHITYQMYKQAANSTMDGMVHQWVEDFVKQRETLNYQIADDPFARRIKTWFKKKVIPDSDDHEEPSDIKSSLKRRRAKVNQAELDLLHDSEVITGFTKL